MPGFEPFAGVRYASAPQSDRASSTAGIDLSHVAAPPYDVIDEHEREALELRSPRNAVRLILPRDIDEPDDRYAQACRTYREWTAARILVADPVPRFYGYRMEYRDLTGTPRHTVGVFGALTLPAAIGSGDILPHERTLPKAKSDRLDLLRATRVNLDPIWGLSSARGLTDLVDQLELLATAVDELGVHHQLFAIDDPHHVEAIRHTVGSAPLVLADGHHRFETACTYRAEQPASDIGAGAILAFVVELADDELCIQPIHRLLTLPEHLRRGGLRTRLAEAFRVTAFSNRIDDADPSTTILDLEAAMLREGALGMIDGDGSWLLKPIETVVDHELLVEPAEVRATDAAIVEACIAPRLDGASWSYRHDPSVLASMVRDGAADAALLLRPVSVDQTRIAAAARVRMPQKTTFFYPKPRTGMVFRTLD